MDFLGVFQGVIVYKSNPPPLDNPTSMKPPSIVNEKCDIVNKVDKKATYG
jgi:hypothetical protein